jgi:hypothetical protein
MQAVAIIFAVLGFALIGSSLTQGNPVLKPNDISFSAVLLSGKFGNWGLVLLAIAGVCMVIRTLIRR